MTDRREPFIDIIKGILCIFVILLHFPYENGESGSIVFTFAINFAVPMFIYISGFVSALSFEAKETTLETAYSPKSILKKLCRLVIPFSIAFVAEWILFRIKGLFMVNVVEYGLLAVVKDWFTGGYGMGSYYFPIMIQFIFVFPVIYFCIRKKGAKGLVLAFFINALYELLKYSYGMNETEYRLLFFRYLFVAAAGCYHALNRDKFPKLLTEILMFIFGIAFIVFFTYSGYSPKILTYWTSTCFLTSMYIIPVMDFLTGWKKRTVRFFPLELAGKASFNIFLTQMIYYCVFIEDINRLISNSLLRITASILICVIGGILFFLLENRFTKFVIKKIDNKDF